MKLNKDIIYDLLDHLDYLADAFDDFCAILGEDDFCATLGEEEQKNFWDRYHVLKELIEDLNPDLFILDKKVEK